MRPNPDRPLELEAFASADALEARRHGPRGYVDDEHYKPWLRDEFTYRCLYCGCREVWFPAVAGLIRADGKTNEHKAAMELPGVPPLAGKVVVGDALF